MARNFGDSLMAMLAIFLASVAGMLLMGPGLWPHGIIVLAFATIIQYFVVRR